MLLFEIHPFSFSGLDLLDFDFYIDWFIKRKEEIVKQQKNIAESTANAQKLSQSSPMDNGMSSGPKFF